MNNKGLSTVVTTVIILALALVAVGILWGPVSNMLTERTGGIAAADKCIDAQIEVVSATLDTAYVAAAEEVAATDAVVTVKVKNIGSKAIDGARAGVGGETGDTTAKLAASAEVGIEVTIPAAVSVGDEVEASAFFTDANGDKVVCASTAKEKVA